MENGIGSKASRTCPEFDPAHPLWIYSALRCRDSVPNIPDGSRSAVITTPRRGCYELHCPRSHSVFHRGSCVACCIRRRVGVSEPCHEVDSATAWSSRAQDGGFVLSNARSLRWSDWAVLRSVWEEVVPPSHLQFVRNRKGRNRSRG